MNFALLLLFFKISQIASLDHCGTVNIQSGLIVNGEEAKRGEYPFLVALYKAQEDKFFCAGNLITRRHVLSGENKQFL